MKLLLSLTGLEGQGGKYPSGANQSQEFQTELTDQLFHFLYALGADLFKPNVPQTVPDTPL